MAWIVKNSATIQIERRAQPYLDDQLKAKLEAEVLPRYPTKRAAVLPALHAVQDKHLWIPHQAMEEIASFLGLEPSEVADTASFYEMFWLQPKGKYLIMVCESISCELMGHERIIDKLRQKLAIDLGQTTPDGKFTLMHAECLGSCGTAPCALVNERLFENLTPENVSQVLDALP